MKAMVIGLRPEYHYPGKFTTWRANNTLNAANLGASLICNTLLRHFQADYIDRFDNLTQLRAQYDVCIMALATHLHPSRDISFFTDIVEKLGIKTIVLSAGIKDYEDAVTPDYPLHPSVKRLLTIAATGSDWIGVRGPYSASVLARHGFRNVVPLGCPSMYWGGNRQLAISKPAHIRAPLLVYHRTLSLSCRKALAKYQLLGQDFEDEIFFTDSIKEDAELLAFIEKFYAHDGRLAENRRLIGKNGVFLSSFEKWFSFLKMHDLIVGPRLHGCLGALTQGVAAVMTPRDLRSREIAEFYRLPTASYEDLERTSAADILASADFTHFNEIYPVRYDNYIAFLEENGLTHTLHQTKNSSVSTEKGHDVSMPAKQAFSLVADQKEMA